MTDADDPAADLRHLEDAERRARMPARLAGVPVLAISRCAVLGCDTMGVSLAWALLRAGLDVRIVEQDRHAISRGRDWIARLAREVAQRGDAGSTGAGALLARLEIRPDDEALAGADLVLDTASKQAGAAGPLRARLDRHAPRAALVVDPSCCDVDEIAAGAPRLRDIVGMHFFAPAHVTSLVEVVPGKATSTPLLATAFGLARRLDKIAVLARPCGGLIADRILGRCQFVADAILLDGGLPWEIDEAMVEFGYAMGPYETQDLSGLGRASAERRCQAMPYDPGRRTALISNRMIEEGRLGKMVGVGWYRYPGGGGAVIDPLLEDLIAEESHFAGVTRRRFTPEDIRRRLLAAMIDEAAQILHERVAGSAAEIDLVSVHAHGFPRWRGGLMRHAAACGYREIAASIDALSREDPTLWTASAGLRVLAQQEAEDSRLIA